MTSTLVDSNVLIDVLDSDEGTNMWSSHRVKQAGELGAVVINQIILAEVSFGFDYLVELERFLLDIDFARESVPWEAAFQAGKAHAVYRQRGGTRHRTLPDFLIGAHAAVTGYRLLTRDARRYRTYFPMVDIIAPDTHP